MNQYNQYEDIKDMFDSVKVPMVDLREKIKSKLEMDTHSIKYKIPNRKVILISIVFIFILSLGAAAKSGVFASFLNNLNNMKQGESAVYKFFDSISNENETVYVTKPVTLNSFEELKETVGDGFIYPGHLPEGYMFREGLLSYIPTHSYESNDENTDEDQDDFKVVETMDKISDYTLIYINGSNQIIIRVSMLKASEEYLLGIENQDKQLFSSIEEANVNGSKAVYAVFASGNKHLVYRDGSYKAEDVGGQQELWWIHDKGIMTLTADSQNNISKEDLIAIAESINTTE